MKTFNTSVIALALTSVVSFSHAATLAINNATIMTATEKGIMNNASVLVEQGKIITVSEQAQQADTVIDAQGKILTPGFIGSMNSLGLVEVGAVATSRDAAEKKADMTFDPSLAYNPLSSAIAYARKGGITTNVTLPRGGESIFKGQAFVVNLTGEYDSVEHANKALYIKLGMKSKGSRAFDLQQLQFKLEDAQKKLKNASTSNQKDNGKDKKQPKRSEKVLLSVLKGEMPVIIDVDRATDILAVIALKNQFQIDIIINGAADAVLVADKLASANIPIMMDAMRNLPGSFDSLHTSMANAGLLAKADVKVMLSSYSTHNLSQLRFDAGNAVANGMTKSDALKAVTANIADAFHLDSGKIEQGRKADLVLWSADPFELSSRVEKLWINGEQQSLRSRQDALRDRFLAESNMPKAYSK